MPKLNIKLLEQIKKHIKEEPRRYEQRTWVCTQRDTDDPINPPCGTIGCIAGWAVLLNTPESEWPAVARGFSQGDQEYQAKKLLGLTKSESDSLFSAGNQKNFRGEAGVRSAVRKINKLIRSRQKSGKRTVKA